MTEIREVSQSYFDKSNSVGIANVNVRKRPLEEDTTSEEFHVKHDRLSENEDELEHASSSISKHASGSTSVLDEIELHFQRSLSQAARRKAAKEDDKTGLTPTPADLPPLIHAFPESSATPTSSPATQTCSTQLSTSSVIPLYVSSGNDTSSRSHVVSTCSGQEETKLKMVPPSLHSTENLSPLSATSKPHVFSSLSSSSLSPGTSKSFSTAQLPFLATSTEKQSLKLSENITTTKHLNTASISNHISSLPPGSHVQVIDLKAWPKSLADSPSTTTVLTSPSAIHFPPPSSHSLRTPTVSSLSNSGNVTINAGVSNPVTIGTSIPALKDVQVAANSASPIMLLPTSTMMVQPQPYVLLNPSELQQVNVAPLLNNGNFFSPATKLVPEVLNTGAGNGFILVSPNPVVQVVSTASTAMVRPGVSTSSQIPTTQPTAYMNISTKTVNPFPSTSHSGARIRDDSIDVMPASVEDHFAKALGDQWPKLNANSAVSPQSTVIS